jgi:hypothetical protein
MKEVNNGNYFPTFHAGSSSSAAIAKPEFKLIL